jgi:cytochrome c556
VFLLLRWGLAPVEGKQQKGSPPKRAKPPAWSRDVLDLFFEDARQQLVGTRPTSPTSAKTNGAGASSGTQGSAQSDQTKWSQIVDGDTLTGEVKRLVAALNEPLSNPAKFKAGGYKACRASFSELAVLFGVIADFDGDVRWKQDAAALRDSLARAGANCKAATDQTFAEAAQRKAELDDLIRGEHLGGKAVPLEKWSALADRELLMKRMEQAMQERVTSAMGNAREFAKQADGVRQEAELLAMFADVIVREDYDYWDDEKFRLHANELKAAAHDLDKAARDSFYDAARASAGRAGQACIACHDEYRG